jgi:3-oxoacyl-(acyl-carrier-protein) synthase
LSAAGSIESIAAVLQLHQGFIFPILLWRLESWNNKYNRCIKNSQKLIETELNIIAKASFGLGMLTAASS